MRSEEARAVLDLLSTNSSGLTLGGLRARTGLSTDSLHAVLDGLRREGLVVRLNTLVESYVCRFPGIRMDDT
jgi:DNA-binding IclR family transcriptional regulator